MFDAQLIVDVNVFACNGRSFQLYASLKDVSGTGFSLGLETPLSADDLVIFTAALSGSDVPRRTLCRVAHCRQGPDGRFVAGVEMLEQEPTEEVIKEFLEVSRIRQALR